VKRALVWSVIAFGACIVIGNVAAGLLVTLAAAIISAAK
jgi:hypothetical protein